LLRTIRLTFASNPSARKRSQPVDLALGDTVSSGFVAQRRDSFADLRGYFNT
jgi:hypothetical protein